MWFRPPWDDGKVGGVGLGDPRVAPLVPWVVAARMVLVFGVLVAGALVPMTVFAGDLSLVAKVEGGMLAYTLFGTILRPQPNLDNLGMARGLLDHPLRVSDDWNRNLLSLQILLYPGRFLGESVIDAYRLLSGEGDPG